nr:hypothetical protein [Tanacetum cinerariifolium]
LQVENNIDGDKDDGDENAGHEKDGGNMNDNGGKTMDKIDGGNKDDGGNINEEGASENEGVCQSTLKRVCRKVNITSWPLPHRHKKHPHLSIFVVMLMLVRMERLSYSSNHHGFSAKWWICGKHSAFDSKLRLIDESSVAARFNNKSHVVVVHQAEKIAKLLQETDVSYLHSVPSETNNVSINIETLVGVGIILDMESLTEKSIRWCITKAISDFYALNPNYRTSRPSSEQRKGPSHHRSRNATSIDLAGFRCFPHGIIQRKEGREILPYLVELVHDKKIHISYMTAISASVMLDLYLLQGILVKLL